MNILYYSVHHVLEDDEVRLFKALGHNVFCLGVNGLGGSVESYRPPIVFSEVERNLHVQFAVLGGVFTYGDVNRTIIPDAFLDLIDVVIVMHDVNFVRRFWPTIHRRPVIWRTIGQGIELYESMMRPYRDAGMLIVRCSPVELEFAGTLGQDWLVRFAKSSEVFGGWNGATSNLLTFANHFGRRYPDDSRDYAAIVAEFPSILGGSANEGLPGAIGMVGWQEQIDLYRSSRAYLYASGMQIPYTLNFIEAWITGIPLIVHAPNERRGAFFEIDRLIQDGVNGFVCRDIDSARARAADVLGDQSLAQTIGASGRRAAMAIFDERAAAAAWRIVFEHLPSASTNRPVTPEPAVPTPPNEALSMVKSMSPRVFEVLSLLRPFDIDREKVRVGGERDGGYIMADIATPSAVISFGVGPDVTFEFEMAQRGIPIVLHDHTVEGTPQTHPLFRFNKLGICGEGESGPSLATLGVHLARPDIPTDKLVLKIDVEGYEWGVFATMSQEQFSRFDQIVMEIHWLQRLADPGFATKAKAALENLNKQFTLFHVHGNNCSELSIVHNFMVANVLELSFVRTSLVERSPSRTVYPSSLNQANNPDFHDLPLLFYPFLPSSVDDFRIGEVVRRIDVEHRLEQGG